MNLKWKIPKMMIHPIIPNLTVLGLKPMIFVQVFAWQEITKIAASEHCRLSFLQLLCAVYIAAIKQHAKSENESSASDTHSFLIMS